MRTFKRTHRRACTHSDIHLLINIMARGTLYTIIRAARAGGAGVEETEGDGDDECDSVVLCVCVCMSVCVCVCGVLFADQSSHMRSPAGICIENAIY